MLTRTHLSTNVKSYNVDCHLNCRIQTERLFKVIGVTGCHARKISVSETVQDKSHGYYGPV